MMTYLNNLGHLYMVASWHKVRQYSIRAQLQNFLISTVMKISWMLSPIIMQAAPRKKNKKANHHYLCHLISRKKEYSFTGIAKSFT